MSRVSFYSTLVLCLMISVSSTDARAQDPNKQKFGGLSLGIGLSLTHDLGWNDRVTKAEVVNGIVRVEEQKNDLARIMLEMHYFITPGARTAEEASWGHGPFVAIAPGGNDKLIDAIGLGWMVGFRQKMSEKGGVVQWAPNSWNFGIGFVVDANSKILGDGIRANQPLPAGESTVRLKDTSQGGIMFITSFSFY